MQKKFEKFRLHPSRRPNAFLSVNMTREQGGCAERSSPSF
jgi:hypothetical protein